MKTKKTPLDLAPFKEQLKIVREKKDSKDNEFNSYGTMNAACWIGERSGFLIAEIERLRLIESAARIVAKSGPIRNGLRDENSMAILDEALNFNQESLK